MAVNRLEMELETLTQGIEEARRMYQGCGNGWRGQLWYRSLRCLQVERDVVLRELGVKR